MISQVLARRLRGVDWKYFVLLCDLRPPARGMGTTTGGWSVVVLVGRQVSPAGCCMFELLVHSDTTWSLDRLLSDLHLHHGGHAHHLCISAR